MPRLINPWWGVFFSIYVLFFAATLECFKALARIRDRGLRVLRISSFFPSELNRLYSFALSRERRAVTRITEKLRAGADS
jgi:hypothetical protein